MISWSRFADHAKELVCGEAACDDLFLDQRNAGVQSKTIQLAVQHFAKKAGIKNVTPYCGGYLSHL